MTRKPEYAVSVYTERATVHVGTFAFNTLHAATRAFHAEIAHRILERDTCVLLSHNTTTLAAKSTDQQSAEFYPAFYGIS